MIRGAIGRAWLRRLTIALAAAAGVTLVSIDRAAAETEAATYLRDKTLCWVLEVLHEDTGTWVQLHKTPIIYGDSAPGTDGDFYLRTFRDSRVNRTNPLEVSLVRSGDRINRSRRLRQVPCPPPLQPTLSTGGLHPFWGVEAGGGWATNRFDVTPGFGANGGGFVSGINGGFLVPLPGSQLLIGPRIGVQGNFFNGTASDPPASPGFDYRVKNEWMAVQESLFQINLGSRPAGGDVTAAYFGSLMYAAISLGIAEGHTSVTGSMAGFSVTDGFSWTGPTVSAGLGVPLNTFIPAPPVVFGGTPFVYGQYRATFAGSGTVNIPGQVRIDPWIQSLNFGLQIRY